MSQPPLVVGSTSSEFGSGSWDMSTDEDDAAGNSSSLKGTRYADFAARRRNFNISNRLHSTGVSLDIDLPQICVLGSQSVGKSSLIESICGVSLPRARGTCTRCPTQCMLSNSEGTWKADVSLKFQYGRDGHPLSSVRELPFGGTITDPTLVEDRLRRAQLAILNPNLDSTDFPSQYLSDPAPTQDTSSLSFSHNVINLRITGPSLDDLSFVDLPGLIASSQNPSDVEQVRELAISYIKNPKSVILLTVACETDFQNQSGAEIVRQYDPDGRRTIGVLTKPDRIDGQRKEREHWLSVLMNETVHFDHGWFCVKLLSPEQLANHVSWAEARVLEQEFFDREEPWASVEAHIHERYTVKRLANRLSEILSDLLTAQLPQLQREIEEMKRRTREELGRLPAPMSNDPVSDVHRLISNFQSAVQTEICGTPYADGLIQKIRKHLMSFRLALRGTAPRFIPFREDEDRRVIPAMGFLDEEERDLGEEGTGPIIYLNEVQDLARDGRSVELPNNFPFSVKRDLIMRSISKWDDPSRELYGQVETTLEQHFAALAQKHFSRFRNLHSAVNAILADQRSERAETMKQKISWLIRAESNATFTFGEHRLAEYHSKFELVYKNIRYHQGQYSRIIHKITSPDTPYPPRYSPPPVTDTETPFSYGRSQVPYAAENYPSASPTEKEQLHALISAISQFGLPGTVDNLLRMIPTDEGDLAVRIMAEVRAYWQVAFKRFIDYIALAINTDFVLGFGDDLDLALRRDLGLNGPNAHERCEAYFAEAPHIVVQREALIGKLQRLEDAQRQIVGLAG